MKRLRCFLLALVLLCLPCLGFSLSEDEIEILPTLGKATLIEIIMTYDAGLNEAEQTILSLEVSLNERNNELSEREKLLNLEKQRLTEQEELFQKSLQMQVEIKKDRNREKFLSFCGGLGSGFLLGVVAE